MEGMEAFTGKLRGPYERKRGKKRWRVVCGETAREKSFESRDEAQAFIDSQEARGGTKGGLQPLDLPQRPDESHLVADWVVRASAAMVQALAADPGNRELQSCSRAMAQLLTVATSAAKRAELEEVVAKLEKQVHDFLDASQYGEGFRDSERWLSAGGHLHAADGEPVRHDGCGVEWLPPDKDSESSELGDEAEEDGQRGEAPDEALN